MYKSLDVYLPKRIIVDMEEEAVRWNLKVSKETDLALRTFLGAQGMKKGDLSKFVEEAVRWRIFHRTVQDIKSRNADADPADLQRMIDEAVDEVRAERR
jgi:Ribbon-helix-helix domain